MYPAVLYYMHAAYAANHILLDVITQTISDEECQWCYSLKVPVTDSFWGQSTYLSTSFLGTLTLHSSPTVTASWKVTQYYVPSFQGTDSGMCWAGWEPGHQAYDWSPAKASQCSVLVHTEDHGQPSYSRRFHSGSPWVSCLLLVPLHK